MDQSLWQPDRDVSAGFLPETPGRVRRRRERPRRLSVSAATAKNRLVYDGNNERNVCAVRQEDDKKHSRAPS